MMQTITDFYYSLIGKLVFIKGTSVAVIEFVSERCVTVRHLPCIDGHKTYVLTYMNDRCVLLDRYNPADRDYNLQHSRVALYQWKDRDGKSRGPVFSISHWFEHIIKDRKL